ncbi:MAG: outer membrane lipoprotein carrier protein LolA [Alphaproteobacteria bacterium]|nr:outer membrane lipoprotein carrier protein LolA [Alphaproteobacteria bacterium]
MVSADITRRLLLASLAAVTTGLAAAMVLAAPPRPLSGDDQATVRRIEAYLNSITTLAGRFLQTSSDGGEASGRFYMWRPGRLRFDYDPPVPYLIVATGDLVIHYDRELKTASHIYQEATPAAFLLKSEIRFERGLRVTDLARRPGVLQLTFVQAKEPEAGSVTLVLGDNPLALRQWVVVDPQGVETRVSLLDYQVGGRLDPKLFEFNEPTWLDEQRKRGN